MKDGKVLNFSLNRSVDVCTLNAYSAREENEKSSVLTNEYVAHESGGHAEDDDEDVGDREVDDEEIGDGVHARRAKDDRDDEGVADEADDEDEAVGDEVDDGHGDAVPVPAVRHLLHQRRVVEVIGEEPVGRLLRLHGAGRARRAVRRPPRAREHQQLLQRPVDVLGDDLGAAADEAPQVGAQGREAGGARRQARGRLLAVGAPTVQVELVRVRQPQRGHLQQGRGRLQHRRGQPQAAAQGSLLLLVLLLVAVVVVVARCRGVAFDHGTPWGSAACEAGALPGASLASDPNRGQGRLGGTRARPLGRFPGQVAAASRVALGSLSGRSRVALGSLSGSSAAFEPVAALGDSPGGSPRRALSAGLSGHWRGAADKGRPLNRDTRVDKHRGTLARASGAGGAPAAGLWLFTSAAKSSAAGAGLGGDRDGPAVAGIAATGCVAEVLCDEGGLRAAVGLARGAAAMRLLGGETAN